MDLGNTSELFTEVELFKSLTEAEQKRLAEVMDVKTFPVNEFLFRENEPRVALYIIDQGAVELSVNDKFGGMKRLVVFGKYDFLSEGALLDDSPHSTSAKALVETKIYSISQEVFLDLFKNHPDIAKKILSRIARVIARRMQQGRG